MILAAGRFQLDLSVPKIMGILNVTPDSFSDGGRYQSVDAALIRVEEMLTHGADIIDIGAESTRPGGQLIDVETELSRLLPVIEAIQQRFNCCVSIDTNKPEVMRAVLSHSVDMINDVRGFVASGAWQAVAASKAAICIMHMQGLPQTMQDNPSYQAVVTDVLAFLQQQAELAKQHGIDQNRIVIDPGFGFGKTPKQNMQLLAHIDTFAAHYPVLFGLSRKSTLGHVLGDMAADRTSASVAGALIAVQNGARIIRVHDVKATKDALSVLNATYPLS
ncbi:dihydropteroate synthase [Ostreibacterium oceani]|uniref:Dihydropteroate synthase n=1 Tax=Ostreibacterium oceani TaxID=2654998 RepID=A0A6N7EYS6_9GAMM|nr:dihydropteroate synthase [Ostreibacterium oceani]MPV86307.1 dihydropteroate synthase [Ostreibacterium oceani]